MEEIASWLKDLGAQVILWSDATAFPPGQFTLTRLVEIARQVSAAVLVFGADDKVWYRESERLQPRDNVLLEFWLFAAHLGFERTLIVREGRSALPSDLGGLQVVPAARRLKTKKIITAWYARINNSVSIFPHDEPNSLGGIRFYRLPRDSSDGDMLNDLKVARRATFLGVSHQHLAGYLAKVVQNHPDTLPLEEVNVCFAAPDDGQLFEGADFLGNVRRSRYDVASTLMDPASRSKLVRFTALRFYHSTRHRTFGGCSLVASGAGEEIFYVNHYLPTVYPKTEDLLTLRFTANAQRDPVGRDILDAYRSAFEVFLNTAQRCGTFTPSLWDLSTQEWHLFASRCRAHQASMSHLISVAGIKKGERVLDIGAATGDTSRLLAEAGAQLTVLDASPNMIRTARGLLGDTVRYAMCSVGSFEDDESIERDGTYDVIVCHLALPALAADGPALRRMADWCSRHLSERGRFALSCHNTAVRTAASTFNPASDPLRETFRRVAADVGLGRFYRQQRAPILTSAEIQRAFRAAGFISDRPVTMRWRMFMPERMLMWSAPAVLDRLFEVRSLDPGAIRSLLERTRAELGKRQTPDMVVTFWVFHRVLSQEVGKIVAPAREHVFISYSHKDFAWLNKLQITLKPLVRQGTLTTWEDTQIDAGSKWKHEIEMALAAAKVAVLLVSPNFLGSDFIVNHELPPLLEAAEKQGLVILWVYVSSCLFEETEIKDYQAAHDISKPLESLTRAEQSRVLVDICRKIKAAATLSRERR